MIEARIIQRAQEAGLHISVDLAADLARYLSVLRRWNRKINLTSLPLDPVSDGAIDRLVVEPLVALSFLTDLDRVIIDIGSGGGSPALPLRLGMGRARKTEMVLTESRQRKAAFLREAIRELGLEGVSVKETRIGMDLDELPPAQVITIRAVRIDFELAVALERLLAPGGRILFFGSESELPGFEKLGFRVVAALRSSGTLFELRPD